MPSSCVSKQQPIEYVKPERRKGMCAAVGWGDVPQQAREACHSRQGEHATTGKGSMPQQAVAIHPNFPATTAQNTQKGSSYSQTRATAAFFMCHIISLSTSSKWRTLLIRFDFPVSNRSRGTVEVDADLHHFPVVCLIRNRIPFAVNLR